MNQKSKFLKLIESPECLKNSAPTYSIEIDDSDWVSKLTEEGYVMIEPRMITVISEPGKDYKQLILKN